MEEKKNLLLLLSYVNGIGPKKMEILTNHIDSIDELKKGFNDIVPILGLSSKDRDNFRKIMNNFCIEETILKYKDNNVSILITDDPLYPPLLKEIYDPPQIIFCKGNTELLNNENNISIVGARKASWYGKKIANELAQFLSENGVTVTSGMASGIDAQAHLGSLEGSGSSIGVLGSGIDIVYPKQNQKIFTEMETNGLLVSTHPLGTMPLPGHFPARNRIISGLSKGVVVVEAQIKSGALITAEFAAEQGRDIFAVPGNINSVMSKGTNKLIKDGAIVVTDYKDVLDEYFNDQIQLSFDKLVKLTEMEEEILKISKGQIFSLEELIITTGVNVQTLLANLLTLELKGLVKKIGSQMYQPMGKVDF